MQDAGEQKTNSTIDLAKLIMAVLVIGIHTEPFHFNIWLDRGFGIITRLCLPFFFIASSYFFFKGNKSLKVYLGRLLLLYVIWSLIYLPFDLKELKVKSVPSILNRYFWSGNEHALWYLLGSVIGMLIVCGLRKLYDLKTIRVISVGLLVIGCLFSTYSPLVERTICGGGYCISVINTIGTRNGLFYAPAYIAVGLWLAEKGFTNKRRWLWQILFVSLIFLVVESIIFVIFFRTTSTVLWLSVYPASYALFQLVATADCRFSKNISIWMRKLSILLYVTHSLFLMAFSFLGYGLTYFLATLLCSCGVSAVIILLSDKVKILRYLY